MRPLGKTQIVYTSVNPQFEQLAADTLGDQATEKDGFDALFTPVALALGDEENNLAAGTAELLDAGFTPGEFEGSNLLPIAADTAAFTDTGDALAADLDGSLTVQQPAAQSGGTTGGGGVGEGGGGGGVAYVPPGVVSVR